MNDLYPGAIVKVLDFVGVITAVKQDGNALWVSIESPKRIALHQTTLDTLDYNLFPEAFENATTLDLLREMLWWFEGRNTNAKFPHEVESQ